MIEEKWNNLVTYTYKLTQDLDLAKDIVQGAYLAYYTKAQKREIEDPFSYLFGIVKINIKHHYFPGTSADIYKRQKKDTLNIKSPKHNSRVSYNDYLFKEELKNYTPDLEVLVCYSFKNKKKNKYIKTKTEYRTPARFEYQPKVKNKDNKKTYEYEGVKQSRSTSIHK